MIQEETRALVHAASVVAESVFNRRGSVSPMFHMVHPDGKHEVVPAPHGDKDLSIAIMKGYFEWAKIIRFVMIDECWRVSARSKSKAELDAIEAFCALHGVSKHPDRVEAIMLMAEDFFGVAHGWRLIERPAKGKPQLGPLQFDPESGIYHGRMVGLLPARGARQ